MNSNSNRSSPIPGGVAGGSVPVGLFSSAFGGFGAPNRSNNVDIGTGTSIGIVNGNELNSRVVGGVGAGAGTAFVASSLISGTGGGAGVISAGVAAAAPQSQPHRAASPVTLAQQQLRMQQQQQQILMQQQQVASRSSGSGSSENKDSANGSTGTITDFGLVALLKLIQMTDAQRNALALEKDPTLLGWDGNVSKFFRSGSMASANAPAEKVAPNSTAGSAPPSPSTVEPSSSSPASPIPAPQSKPPMMPLPQAQLQTQSQAQPQSAPAPALPTASSNANANASGNIGNVGGPPGSSLAPAPVPTQATANGTATAPSNNNASKLQQLVQNLPACYLMNQNGVAQAPPNLTLGHFQKFTVETLMYLFHNLAGDVLQAHAAQELYGRNWRFHGAHNLWFQKTSAEANDVNYFDVPTWSIKPTPPGTMTPALLQGLLSEDDIRVVASKASNGGNGGVSVSNAGAIAPGSGVTGSAGGPAANLLAPEAVSATASS